MIWEIFSVTLVILAAIFSQWWLAGIGVFLLILSSIPTRPRRAPSSGKPTKLKHKLIQAPEDAWEDDDAMTFMAMQMGPPIFSGVDMLSSVAEAGRSGNPLATGILRRMLPFPNYGESSALQRMFAGLIVPIDSVLFKNSYKYKFGNKKLKSNVDDWIAGGESNTE